MIYFYSCPACEGRYPSLASMNEMSMQDGQMIRWLRKAGFNLENDEIVQLHHCCKRATPPTKPMLPKLLALLRIFHEADLKVEKWYHLLQEAIKHHFRTQGNCMFTEGSVRIMSGEEQDFDWMDAFKNLKVSEE